MYSIRTRIAKRLRSYCVTIFVIVLVLPAKGTISRTVKYLDSKVQRSTVKNDIDRSGYKGKVKTYVSGDVFTKFITAIVPSKHGSKDSVIDGFRSYGWNVFGNFDRVIDVSDVGFKLSEDICGVPWEHRNANPDKVGFHNMLDKNETDAVRHFAASALLTVEFGLPKAKLLMTAREEGQVVERDELMDLHNNELGFREGLVIREAMQSRSLSPEDIEKKVKAAALRHLQSGRLSVILSGGDRQTPGCTYSNLYPNRKHLDVDLASHFVLKNGIPKACQGPLFKRCLARKTSRQITFCLTKSMNRDLDRLRRTIEESKNSQHAKQGMRGLAPNHISVEERMLRAIKTCQRDMKNMVSFFGEPRDTLSYPDGELPKAVHSPFSR